VGFQEAGYDMGSGLVVLDVNDGHYLVGVGHVALPLVRRRRANVSMHEAIPKIKEETTRWDRVDKSCPVCLLEPLRASAEHVYYVE
jgi:ribosomal protein L14E/L6E/L27E